MTTLRYSLVAVAAILAAAAGRLGAQGTGIPGEIIPTPDQPPTRQGTRGANFLEIGIGARAAGMSGATTATVEGPLAWYWNPAGAASLETFSIAATRQNLYTDLDITQNYFGAGLPFLGGVFGLSFNSLNSGEMPRSTEEEPFGDPIVGETFEWSSSAIGVGFARRLTDRLDLGLGLKFVSEGLTDARTSWVALDFGTQFRTGLYGLTLGASLQNIGPSSQARGSLITRRVNTDEFSNQFTRVEFETQEAELPTLFRFSIGSDVLGTASSLFGQREGRHRLIAELTFDDAIDTAPQGALGGEYSFANMFFVRAGKRFYNDDRATGRRGLYGLSGGGGLRVPFSGRAVRFDYGYTSLGDLDNVQVFSFEFGR